MVFSSPTFICLFLPLTLGLYVLLPGRMNNAVLVAASIVFYAWGDPVAALALIIPSVAINFQLGRLIGAAEGAPAQTGHRGDRAQPLRPDRVQVCAVPGRQSQRRAGRRGRSGAAAAEHPPAARHLVFHLSHSLLSDRRLSRGDPAAAVARG